MKASISSRLLLLSTAAAVLCSAAFVVALTHSGGITERSVLGSASAAGAPSVPIADAEFPICHTPVETKNSALIRFAAIQTEVPRAEMKAATPSTAFVDTD